MHVSDVQNEPCTHFWQGNLATRGSYSAPFLFICLLSCRWNGEANHSALSSADGICLLDLRRADALVQINCDAQSRALRYRRVRIAGIDDAIAVNHARVDHSVPRQKYER